MDLNTPFFGKDRPTLKIEETPIDHLNAKTWIPGKARWENLKFTTSADAAKAVGPKIIEGKKFDCEFKNYKNDILIESWSIKNAWLFKSTFRESQLYVELAIDKVRYEPRQ